MSAAGALLLMACGPAPAGETASGWPEGTTIGLTWKEVPAFAPEPDGRAAILESEVDEVLPAVKLLADGNTDDHLRRLALTNVAMPRALVRMAFPRERQEALERLQRIRREVVDGDVYGPVRPEDAAGRVVEGYYKELGLVGWNEALQLEDGVWSEIREDAGAFLFLRVLERTPGPMPAATSFRVQMHTATFLPEGFGAQAIEAAYDSVQMEIVDPEWRVLVPELYQYKMGVHE